MEVLFGIHAIGLLVSFFVAGILVGVLFSHIRTKKITSVKDGPSELFQKDNDPLAH